MSAHAEDSAVVSGVGSSAVGRGLDRSALSLALEAIKNAVADAGLTLGDIDGVATWPGRADHMPGFSGVGVAEVQQALGLELDWYCGGPEGPGQLAQVLNAIAAVHAGFARHVVCFRVVTEASVRRSGRRPSQSGTGGGRVSGSTALLAPYYATSAAVWVALLARRHMELFGTTRADLARIAINNRANAALNEAAVLREPLTLDDYFAARTVSDPLCLLDCDIPVDGCTAVVISAADTAGDLRRPPVRILASGGALHDSPTWFGRADLDTMAAHDAAAMMWSRTDLTPADVDFGELYDGFSFLTLIWLEALGFCERGEVGAFLDEGRTIARDGALPLDTQGGQLSGGRLHGLGFLHEAVLQLQGRAGGRQLQGKHEVAVVSAGGGPLAGCLLLGRG
ncbi:thiolase family protein [Nocardia higoensis]|uniref:thiolase family protein n=1 Tax=Nocardia higoensis TaxID=228599 RepID=UPI00031E7674|nr:thiolase family protein [Nocardia higoensis]